MREKAPLATLALHSAVVLGLRVVEEWKLRSLRSLHTLQLLYGHKSCGIFILCTKVARASLGGSVVGRTNTWTGEKRSETPFILHKPPCASQNWNPPLFSPALRQWDWARVGLKC